MSRRTAKYTQAEIRRATKVAKAHGMAVRVADDGIWIVPPSPEGPQIAGQIEPTRRIPL